MSDTEPTLDELFEDGRAIDEALWEAARDARRFHKAMGNPMATWIDGAWSGSSPRTSGLRTPRRTPNQGNDLRGAGSVAGPVAYV